MKFRQSIAIFVSFILVAEQTALYAGGIEVDNQAPNANKAMLLNAPNNVPIINIVTPNSSGLSHNKFTNFNAENKGLILNNSKVITDTQLAGYISYNPNITGNEAKLILNEVTSTNKTLLQGYIEVAGKSADVIIANPNGISVNGGGFINTPNATLTTGTPMLNGGILQGFDVGKGNIVIEGSGFNGNNIDKVNLYAKALEINAKIYANELNVVTGENNISQDGTVTSKNKIGSGISIDSTLLGGIYANTITLKSTDKGIGVNLPPEVIAQDNLKLNADGKIVLDKVISEKNIDIQSTSSDIASKTIYAQNVNIEAKGNIKNENIIASKVNIDLKAKSIINENIIASGVTEELKDSISGNLTINSQELENKKTLYAKDNINIKSTNITSNNSNIQALGSISIISDSLQSKDSFIFANKNIFIDGEDVILDKSIIYNVIDDMNILIHANNNLSLTNANILTNSNASLEATNGVLTFGDSNITTKNNLSLIGNSINGNGTTSTKIFSGNELNIISNSDLIDLDNTNISSANTINLKTKANTITLNNAQLNSNNNISFSSENLNLNNSKINTVNKDTQIYLENTNRLALNNSSILTDNFIFDKEDTSTSLVSLTNKSVIKSDNTNANITLKANDITIVDSNILTQGKVTLLSKNIFDLNNITLLANNGLYLNTANDFIYDLNKELLSDKLISISSKSFTNNKDFISNGDIFITTTNGNLVNNKLLSSTNTNLNISGNIINNAILASTNLNANASSFYNNNYLTATNNMNINIDNDFINKAAIATGNDLTIYSSNLTNYNTIYSNNNINLYIKNNLLNETNENYVSGLDYARIYAKNNITLAKDINHNYINNITNKSAIIETERGDIGIWADTLTNRRILDYTDNAFLTSESITDSIYFEEGKSYPNKGENGIVNNFFITRGQDIHLFANDSEFSLIIDLAREPFPFHYATVDVTLDKKVQYDNPLYKGSKISSGQNLNLNVNTIDNQISTISAVKDINFNTNTITNYYDSNYNTNISFKTYHTREGRPYYYSSGYYLVECLDSDITCNYGIYASAQSGVLRRGNTVLKATGGNVLGDYDYGTYTTTQSIGLGGTILAGNSINGIAKNLINGTVLDNQTIFPTTYTDTSKIVTNRTKSNEIKYDDESKNTINGMSSVDNLAPIELPTNEFGMFKKTTNPKANYIIESNPIYTDVSKFISSAYFLERLGYDVGENTKFLGDGMYETKLIRDEVIRKTGQRFINLDNISTPITSDYEQYMALMDNAISISNGLKLEVGVPLNEEQLALLDRDIVWMEKVVVEGKEVLVPVLYLAGKYTKPNGALINANNEINLGISGTFVNSGTIKAEESLVLEANEIKNNAGSIISDGLTKLTALNDIKNSSGTILGDSVLLQSTDGRVINETYSKTKTIGSNTYETTYTNVGKTGIVEATNGNLIIQAKDDITNIGANLVAKDNILLQTQNENININALELEDGHNIYYSGGFDKALNIKHQTSDIKAGNIIMQSGNDINLEASNLTANNQINLNAQNNVNIEAVNDVYYTDVQSTKKGRFSKKTQRDMTYKESVVQSNLKGENIIISSDTGSVTLESGNLKADQNIIVDAKEDINVVSKQYKEGGLHQTSKSSWGGLKKSVSIDKFDNLNLKEAQLQTEALNVILKSGKDINIIASDINSAADVQLEAFNKLLIAAGEEMQQKESLRQKTSFNPLGLLNLVGVDAGSIYTQEINQNKNYDTKIKESNITAGNNFTADTGSTQVIGSNIKAGKDISITSDINSVEIVSAQELSQASKLNKKTEVKVSNIFDMAKSLVQQDINMLKAVTNPSSEGSTKIKINVAKATYDKDEITSSATKNISSNLVSNNGNININSSEDVQIKGSNLEAKEDINLTAQTGNITIEETVDTKNIDEKNKHASADVNVTIQNEYVEIASAVKAAEESAKQLKQIKDDYSNYKKQVKELENNLNQLKQDLREKKVGVDAQDIEDIQEIVDDAKDDERYYLAAVAVATADLASKTAAIATQVAAAAASSGTWGFSAGVSLDVKGSQTTSNAQETKSLASNLNANNITIKTNKDLDTNVTVSGSTLLAKDEINIDTKDLTIKASSDTTNSKSDTKDISGSVSMTMYNVSPQVSLGYGEQHYDEDSVTYNNSQLQANNVNINVANSADLIGANVNADDTLTLNVGNNLNIESKRNSNNSNSNGFNLSGGFGTSGGSVTSANASVGANTGRTKIKQTVLSSVTGDKVNVTTGNNTNLKGSLLASGQYDENGNFVDNEDLNLKTKTITYSNSTDSTYTSGNSFSVGTNIGFSKEAKDPQPKDDSITKINSTNLAFSNSLGYQRNKTLATLGQGNVNISDTQNSDDITSLNRDTKNISKTMINTSYGVKVDATLDHRLLTEEGREEIKQEYKDMDKNMKTISDTLPSATSDNEVEAVAGKIWDNIAAYATLGVLPSNGNNGGVLGEIPILTGNKDSVKEVLQVVSQNAPLYQEDTDKFMPIEQSDAYKQMSPERQTQVQGLYISKEPIIITKDNATYQNGGNGIMNDKGLAIINVLEQTGMIGQYQTDKTKPVEATVFYNPSRGIVADLLESAVDKVGGTTGIAKQYGEFNVDVTTARGTAGVNITNHSQLNILLKSGINYINSSDNTGAKFMPQEYFATGEVDKDGRAVYKTPTYVSFGSPESGKTLETLISNKETGLGYTYKGAFTKTGDFVGEGLGGNSGVNGEASIIDRINLFNTLKLITPDSPHSSYKPTDYPELQDVTGYKE